MSSSNLNIMMPTVIFMVIAVLMVVGALVVGKLLRPHNPTPLKLQEYECGETPVGQAWSAFNIRFYVVGLIFIIFDVESALMFPVASVFKKFNEQGLGVLVLCSFLFFIFILVGGIAYCWRKGDLDWVKSFQLPPVEKNKL